MGRYMMVGAAEHGFLDGLRRRALICESDLLGERQPPPAGQPAHHQHRYLDPQPGGAASRPAGGAPSTASAATSA
ncbi:hypothetical protein M8494_14045 [Serratia ureilytica]